MKITLIPIFSNNLLEISKEADALTINGSVYDFSIIPDGATLPAEAVDCEYIIRDVERIDGDLKITLLFPIADAASEAARFPAPIIDPADGLLELPK